MLETLKFKAGRPFDFAGIIPAAAEGFEFEVGDFDSRYVLLLYSVVLSSVILSLLGPL